MNKRNTVIGAILAATILAVPLLHARPERHHGPGGPGPGPGIFGHLKHVKEELNLSDGQVDQIRAIFADLHSKNDAYRVQARGGMRDATKTLLENPSNLSAAQAILDQQTSAEKVMKANRLAATAKALSVLTPEQRSELAKMMEERGERRRELRERRR